MPNQGLFDDYVETEEVVEEPTEEAEEAEATEEVETPTETTETDQPFLNIRYDKSDVPLTREEAITLAQKGMNYGRLEDKLSQANSQYAELYGQLENYANAVGMDVPTYLNRLAQLNLSAQANREFTQLKGQFKDADEKLLKEIALERAQKKLNTNLEKLNQAKRDKVAQAEQNQRFSEERIGRMIDNFLERYPNLDPAKLDQRVYQLMDEKDYTLLEAYQTYVSEQKEKSLESEKKEKLNTANKSKSYGDLTNTDEKTVDDFMAGFLS